MRVKGVGVRPKNQSRRPLRSQAHISPTQLLHGGTGRNGTTGAETPSLLPGRQTLTRKEKRDPGADA